MGSFKFFYLQACTNEFSLFTLQISPKLSIYIKKNTLKLQYGRLKWLYKKKDIQNHRTMQLKHSLLAETISVTDRLRLLQEVVGNLLIQ